MNVSVLQQFLHNLLLPLEASAASPQTLAALKRACQGFEPFRDKEVGVFADFLARAADYERDGHWPSFNPPIAGAVVDEPNAQEYAHRLRTFLEREVPSGGPIPDPARAELLRLAKRLKPALVKEIAREFQIEDAFRSAEQGIEKIVFRLTGLNLKEKKTSARVRSASKKIDPASIPQCAAELQALAEKEGFQPRFEELVKSLSVPLLQKLAECVGVTKKARKKPELTALIRSALEASHGEEASSTPAEAARNELASRDDKISRLAEIVEAMKAKADGPDAPYDEIEAELRSLEGQMDRDEALAVAQRIGIVRHLNSRTDALEEIRRKVFEMKRARESIAY